MHRAPKDAAPNIDIGPKLNETLRRLIILLPNGKAQGSAAVFVQEVRIGLIHQEPIYDPSISHNCCFVEWRPLPIISLVFIEIVIGVVFEKGNQGALVHLVLLQQITEHHQRLKYLLAVPGLPRYVLRLWRLGVDEPLQRQLPQVCQLQKTAWE